MVKRYTPGPARLLRGGLRLAHDGRNRRRQRLGLLGGRGDGLALVPRVPALARAALLVGRQLGPVLIADESRPRSARPVEAALDAAAHVQRAPRPGRLGRQPHDALRGHGGGQLSLRGQAPVALEDALLLRGGELADVLLAEPAIARIGPRLAATR